MGSMRREAAAMHAVLKRAEDSPDAAKVVHVELQRLRGMVERISGGNEAIAAKIDALQNNINAQVPTFSRKTDKRPP